MDTFTVKYCALFNGLMLELWSGVVEAFDGGDARLLASRMLPRFRIGDLGIMPGGKDVFDKFEFAHGPYQRVYSVQRLRG